MAADSDNRAATMDAFVAELRASVPEGEREQFDADMEHLVPLILMPSIGLMQKEQAEPGLLDLISSFCFRAQIDGSETPEETQQKVAAYYETYPPNRKLYDKIQLFLKGLEREAIVSGSEELARRFGSKRQTSDPLRPPSAGIGLRKK